MSRSIHKTVKGVFGGKSAREIDLMIEENDIDVEDLCKKYSYKISQQNKRAIEKQKSNNENEQ